MKKLYKKEIFSHNIEAGFLEIVKPQVEFMFKKLSKMSPNPEKEWKELFAKNVILYIDDFLQEMSEELEIPYNKDMRIENLKKYIDSINKE